MTKKQAASIANIGQLLSLGFVEYKRMRPYVPAYFSIDGTPGDFSDTVYRSPFLKRLVTVSHSQEFGIFSVTLGDARGQNKFS